MAMPVEMHRPFRLYVTHVDGEGPFLRISGQLDKQAACMVESLIDSARDAFEQGIGAVPPASILEGIICAAKYKDGTYYRAKIISTSHLPSGLVGVHFIDYGNKDTISLSTIRFLESYDPLLLQLRGQATDYYLAAIMHPSARWEEPVILKLQSLLCYSEYATTIKAQTHSIPIIAIQFQGNDLTDHLIANKYGISVPLAKQEVLMQMTGDNLKPLSSWPTNYRPEPPRFTEHVPFFTNQGVLSNPASAMRLQKLGLPLNTAYVTQPTAISQRLLVGKTGRAVPSIDLRTPVRQLNQVVPGHPQSPLSSGAIPPAIPIGSPKRSSKTYKSRLLEVNSEHKIFISYAEEGPEVFAVQITNDAKKLQEMMDEINRQPHRSLTEPPMIGTVCLGRMSGDRIICRAIVMNLSGSQCKLFFVDFGDTEMVSYYDIFDIPEEFVKPYVFATRFCLSGVKKLQRSPHLNETFKQLVSGKMMTLRVVPPEGPPLIQYGELYHDNKNCLDILMSTSTIKDTLQFKWMEMLQRGSKHSVLVSYVDSCLKFYIQPSATIDDLNAVMDAVKVHAEGSASPGELPVNAACCAKFPDDGNWYRARVLAVKGNKATVAYVDYGNEQEVDISDLRTITPNLIQLPAQALKCALKGFEDKPVETKTSNQLEMLALEKTLMAQIVGVLSNDTMLVTLIDDSVSPPLDVARKMTQLSQPRSHEPKSTTPNRKDAPEPVFSSPEAGSDDGRKAFQRQKSFKEDRRPRDDEEFGNRGGSFRGRENRDGFDRSGPGRHSEKFGGRPDRGERRGGRPWENQQEAPISAAEDTWEDNPAPPPPAPQANSRPFRDNKQHHDRRKPRDQPDRPDRNDRPDRPDKSGKPGWKKGKEGEGSRNSIQDRLKRDNKFNKPEDRENTNNEWDSNRRDRPRQERGSWGDKREPFQKRDREDRPFQKREFGDGDNRPGFQKREFAHGENRPPFQKREFGDGDRPNRDGFQKRDGFQNREFRDRNERPDRNRSNFTPRDRADRSFGSDTDKKSDKSFGSRDGKNRNSPNKPRRFENKELPSPVSLETPFLEPAIDPNAQHEVSVTWIVSPDSFYTQILSQQPKFLEMMHSIPEVYKGVKPYSGVPNVGASVLARYPEDGVLYRATVVSVQPFGKFIVQYIDFGNKFLVDARDIWQLDSQLMELPKMAVHCSLVGVGPKEGEWKANAEIDLCFNAPRYQCVYQECVEGKYKVSLWNNGVSVGDLLVEKDLASMAEQGASVTLKDEAIDLTIIVEQQVLGRVTHVAGYDKFYVQLDLDKAALVESAIDNFDTSLLTPLTAESLFADVHCTVKHEGKIRRAIITDAADHASVKAVLPDYGLEVTTSLQNLMILPRELSVYYYQSLTCRLNNYTEEATKLMTLDEMKERLTDKKVILFINDVDEVVLVTTLYDATTGHKIGIFTPDSGAYDCVGPLCARAVFNYNFGLAYISHLRSLHEIYLQKATDTDRIAQLLEDLFKFYEEGAPEALTTFEAESLCAAKSSDGNWYRATITNSTETDCTVQFTDYGNSETVPKESVKKLDPSFYEPNALALIVSLGLAASSDEAITKLKEWTDEKEVQVTVSIGNDGWLANLHLDGVDLSVKLVNENLAGPPKAEEAVEPVSEPISLPEGCMQVYISHIDSPGQFWLQMSDKVDAIEEIQAELQEKFSTYADIEGREMGTFCVAKYSADDQWYRAEILDSDSDITTVRFIDYGNTDVLDVVPGILKVIPDHLKQVEGYAVKSSVNAVPSGTGQWSEPASDYFTQLVGDTSAPVDALVVLKDVTTYVDIFVNGQNITDKLVSEGHATRSEDNECGDLPSCFASHVNSPSEFWIQLESAATELQSMENAMVDAENFPELTDKEEGVICAAKYPEDDAWYRAQIIVEGSEGTEVLFMDYGNASIATELRCLPDELKVKPALSRKCALQKPRDIKSWSRKSEIKFNELAAEGATIFKVQFIASGDISIVELYLEGKSVTEELVGLCEQVVGSTPQTERPSPLGQDLQSTGTICFVHAHDEFYIHLDNSSDDIGKVMERMIDAPEFEVASELKVGSLCAAFWAEDEQWYRAKILEFCDVGSHVQFIDYGNKAKCEEFRQLPEDLAAIEPLAKCCCLAGLPDAAALQEKAKNKLDDLVIELTTFQIEFLDSTKEPALVRLNLFGEDITHVIINSSKPETETMVSEKDETAKLILDGIVEAATAETVDVMESAAANNVSKPESETKNVATVSGKDETAKQIVDGIVEAATAEKVKPIESTLANSVGKSETETKEAATASEKVETAKEIVDGIVEVATTNSTAANNVSKLETETKEAATVSKKDETAKQIVDGIVEAATMKKIAPTEPIAATNEVVSDIQSLVKEPIQNAVEKKTETVKDEVTESQKIVSDIVDAATAEKAKKCKETTENKTETAKTLVDEIVDAATSESESKENGFDETSGEDLNSSLNDANESICSSDTVIENKSFEANPDEVDAENKDDTKSADSSSETLESSSGTLKSPERDESKESINTDTGYTSGGEKSPVADSKLDNGSTDVSPEKLQLDEKIQTVADKIAVPSE